jgi:hypothetical protein
LSSPSDIARDGHHGPPGIDDMLAEERNIAIVRSVEDVQELRSDLSEGQG